MCDGAGALPDLSAIKRQRWQPTAHLAQITNWCLGKKGVLGEQQPSLWPLWLSQRTQPCRRQQVIRVTERWIQTMIYPRWSNHAWVYFLHTLPSKTPILCLQRPLLRDATLIHRLSWELYIHTSRLLMRPPGRSSRQSQISFLFMNLISIHYMWQKCGHFKIRSKQQIRLWPGSN